MVNSQTVAKSVNKGILIGFEVTTTGGTSTALVAAATIVAVGAKVIREISLKLTGDDALLGLGVTATTTAGEDIIPIFNNTPFTLENCAYESLNIIRDASTNVTARGYVVVN